MSRHCVRSAITKEIRLYRESSGPSGAQESTGVLVTDLRIGSFHLQNLAVFSTDLKAKFLTVGVSIDGILGTDVLRQFVVTIDLARGTANPCKRRLLSHVFANRWCCSCKAIKWT